MIDTWFHTAPDAITAVVHRAGACLNGPPWRRALVLAMVFLVATLALTWPLAPRIGEALPGNLGDPLLNATILGWNVQWFTGDRAGAFWDAPIFHPYENTLAYSEHLIGPTLFVWPVFALTGNAILTYNVALIAAFVTFGLAAYLWLHALTGRRDVAIVFALALTFAPFRMSAQLARLQMLATGGLPLALWAVHRYGDTGRNRYLWGFGAGVLLLVLSNMYMLFLAALPLTALTVYTVSTARGRRMRTAAGLALATATAALLLLPVIQPYRALDREIGLVHADDHAADYSAHLTSYAAAHTGSPDLPWAFTETTGDQALYPGLVLLLPGLALAWRGVRLGIAPDHRSRAFVYALVGAAAVWLSFGPALRTADGALVATSPYAWLRDVIPGFEAVRAPGRFAAIASFSLAAIGALVMARLTRRTTAARRLGYAALALCVVTAEAWPSASTVTAVSASGRAEDRDLYAWLGCQPSSALFELPASPITADDPGVEILHQFETLEHPHRLVNGYSGFTPPIAGLLEAHSSPFMHREGVLAGVALLQSIGVRFIVVHPHDFAAHERPDALVHALSALPAVSRTHAIGAHYVLELRPGRRARVTPPTRTVPSRRR